MKLSHSSISDFVSLLGSSAPAPGGGAASALTGALGISLTRMVSELTIGKKKFADYEELNLVAIDKCKGLEKRLLEAVDHDKEAFSEVAKVFALPKTTEEEKAYRKEAMQRALKIAIQPPLLTLQTVYEAIEVTQSITLKSNPTVASDIGVAAHHLKAALESSKVNVDVNLNMIKDPAYVAEWGEKSQQLTQEGIAKANAIIEAIQHQLKG